MVEDQVESDLLGETIQIMVYLPPCYDQFPEMDFPTLYLIHGQGYDQLQWADLGVTNLEDQWVREGTAPPVMMVMPYVTEWDGPSEWPFGQAVVEELIPYIEEHYQARSGREWRAVGGISRGASWALHLGLKYWDHFAAFGGHSLPVFYDDAPSVPFWLDAIPTDELPAITFDYAESDQSVIRRSADVFMAQLEERGIPYTFSTAPGAHTQAYWASQADRYLRFYLSLWGE
jgi:enterochelin esterase-like enzyme